MLLLRRPRFLCDDIGDGDRLSRDFRLSVCLVLLALRLRRRSIRRDFRSTPRDRERRGRSVAFDASLPPLRRRLRLRLRLMRRLVRLLLLLLS